MISTLSLRATRALVRRRILFSLDPVFIEVYKAVLCALGAVGSAALLFAPFTRKYRDASRWLRSVWFAGSLLILAWSVLSLVCFFSPFTCWQHSWISGHISGIWGVGAGMLLAVVSSPEFRQRSARRPHASNQSLEPTAGRRNEKLKDEL